MARLSALVAVVAAASCLALASAGIVEDAGVHAGDFIGIDFTGKKSVGVPMQLHLMNDEVANGVTCLDGTPAGFYFSKATSPKTTNSWQIYFQGGGWFVCS